MQRKLGLSRTGIWIFIGLLAIGATAVAQTVAAGEKGGYRCSNRTLSGDYGCSVQGVLLNVPNLPPEARFVAVTTSHFDGAGTVTGKEHAVINGMSFNLLGEYDFSDEKLWDSVGIRLPKLPR